MRIPRQHPPADHTWGDWRFWHHRGIISTLPPGCIERHLAEVEKRGEAPASRGVEAFLNHQHPNPSLCTSREGVRLCLDTAAELGQGLQSGWPDRSFEIFCGLGQDYVTFYQVEPDLEAPVIAIADAERAHSVWTDAEDLAWCDGCGRDRGFTLVEMPDGEFPMLRWSRCAICGYENVLGWCRVTFGIGPGIDQQFLVGGYVPQPDPAINIVIDRQVL